MILNVARGLEGARGVHPLLRGGARRRHQPRAALARGAAARADHLRPRGEAARGVGLPRGAAAVRGPPGPKPRERREVHGADGRAGRPAREVPLPLRAPGRTQPAAGAPEAVRRASDDLEAWTEQALGRGLRSGAEELPGGLGEMDRAAASPNPTFERQAKVYEAEGIRVVPVPIFPTGEGGPPLPRPWRTGRRRSTRPKGSGSCPSRSSRWARAAPLPRPGGAEAEPPRAGERLVYARCARSPLPGLEDLLEVDRLHLLAGEGPLDRGKTEDRPEEAREDPVAREGPVVEDEVREVPALERHPHDAPRRVARGDHPLLRAGRDGARPAGRRGRRRRSRGTPLRRGSRPGVRGRAGRPRAGASSPRRGRPSRRRRSRCTVRRRPRGGSRSCGRAGRRRSASAPGAPRSSSRSSCR